MTDQGPLCPEHPDRPSVGTCTRCGRFACGSCFRPDTRMCTACGSRFPDPLGVRFMPFSVGRVLEAAWRLTRAALPAAIGVPVLMVLYAYLWNLVQFQVVDVESMHSADDIQAVLRAGQFLRAIGRSVVVGPFVSGLLLAQMAGAAQGEAVSVLQALGRSAKAYRRLVWAEVVINVAVLVGAIVFVIPGLFAAVVLWLMLPAAYLEPGQPATVTSVKLTRGRRWPVFALVLVSRAGILVTTVANYAVMLWAAQTGLSAEGVAPMLTFSEYGSDLVQELAESFAVAMTLAAYFSLRHAANQEQPQQAPATPLAA